MTVTTAGCQRAPAQKGADQCPSLPAKPGKARICPPPAPFVVIKPRTKPRPRLSPAKQPMLDAIHYVLHEVLGPYWPTSDRKVHYELLNDPPLVHASKPGRYDNTSRHYDDLTDVLTRGRLEGRIPWEALHDETRPCVTWSIWADPRDFVRAQLDDFLRGYYRDLLQSQPHHIELLCEKNTVYNIVRNVAMTYCLPVTSGRGFAAIERYREMMLRYRASGKDRLRLLMLTDHDPEGETIVQVAGQTLRDDFGVEAVDVLKVALITDQVRAYNLPPILDAKESSANYAAFVREYGTTAYELEALSPQLQQDLLRQAIESVLDLDAFQEEQARERRERVQMARLRRRSRRGLNQELDAFIA